MSSGALLLLAVACLAASIVIGPHYARTWLGLVLTGVVAGLIAAVGALGDDTHVADQRVRYEERRELAIKALGAIGLVHDGGPGLFYLWLRQEDGADDGWEIAAQLATSAGLLVAPGDLYGAPGADHVRLALVQPRERFELAFDRLARGAS